MTTLDDPKTLAARAALDHLVEGTVVGVGTGSTIDRFIDALAPRAGRFLGVVSSSDRSSARLAALGFRVLDANAIERLPVYVDGADEIDGRGCMIKGGGAALTREKIVADLADRFVCIAEERKRVDRLGGFPLPVEVIPMASNRIARRFASAFGGKATLREGVRTDNGNPILDVRGLAIKDPLAMEAEINQWPGVVTVGLFARRRADLCLLGSASGVRTLNFV